jgi:uncharacterized protein (UPF0262 family)
MKKSVMCSGSSDEMMTATAIISFLISTSYLDEVRPSKPSNINALDTSEVSSRHGTAMC